MIKKYFPIGLAIFIIPLLASFLFIPVIKQSIAQNNGEQTENRKIIVWKKGVENKVKEEIIAGSRVLKHKDLSILDASVVFLPDKTTEKFLKNHPDILRVDDDVIVEALALKDSARESGSKNNKVGQLAQVLPWGIDRIDAEKLWSSNITPDKIRVAVIDTGISNTHPDLTPNVKGGYNAISSRKSWNDDNGHGSHVAGIIAALNNSIGTVGVGPNIDLYAVKVLDRNGSGRLSDVIEGIQWAVVKNVQVINMSLGTASDIQSFHDAVIAAESAGVVVVAAAGNSVGSDAVIFPAAYPEVIAVSATDVNDNLASWSSRGPEVDLAAPGVSVYSTYKGAGYATLSGTSMAAPHVAGSAAWVLATPVGSYDANSNGKWDPSEVQQKLQDRSVDLGTPGFDNLFGWGLVNAYNAVQL